MLASSGKQCAHFEQSTFWTSWGINQQTLSTDSESDFPPEPESNFDNSDSTSEDENSSDQIPFWVDAGVGVVGVCDVFGRSSRGLALITLTGNNNLKVSIRTTKDPTPTTPV